MKLNDILILFGKPEARENFLHLCREYYGEAVRQEAATQFNHPVMNSRRAELHTEIMTIVQKLFLRVPGRMPARRQVGEVPKGNRCHASGRVFRE